MRQLSPGKVDRKELMLCVATIGMPLGLAREDKETRLRRDAQKVFRNNKSSGAKAGICRNEPGNSTFYATVVGDQVLCRKGRTTR